MDVVASSKSGLVLAMTMMTMMTIAVMLVASSIVVHIGATANGASDDSSGKDVKRLKEKVKEKVKGFVPSIGGYPYPHILPPTGCNRC